MTMIFFPLCSTYWNYLSTFGAWACHLQRDFDSQLYHIFHGVASDWSLLQHFRIFEAIVPQSWIAEL